MDASHVSSGTTLLRLVGYIVLRAEMETENDTTSLDPVQFFFRVGHYLFFITTNLYSVIFPPYSVLFVYLFPLQFFH